MTSRMESRSQGNPSRKNIQSHLALQACTSCRLNKRKCDRNLPQCALCLRFRRQCLYPERANAHRLRVSSTDKDNGRNKTSPAAEPVASSQQMRRRTANGFPPVYFVDRRIFDRCQVPLPTSIALADDMAQEALEQVNESGLRELIDSYFEGVHAWLPILSAKKFIETSLNPWADRRADNILLLLCMKLVTSSPSTLDKWDESQSLYGIVKRYQLNLQLVGGCFSLQCLQAELLIAVYELGHAIYPAAYFTVASCARLGTALGLDKIQSRQCLPADGGGYLYRSWPMEEEEKSRAWWAAIILDRFALLGNEDRPLCIKDPDMDTFLPVDDADWDNGVLALAEPIRLSSPSSLVMGKFPRLAQAAHLLGQAIRHVSDVKTDGYFHNEERLQLDRTLQALAKLSGLESEIKNILYCGNVAACTSALMIIHSTYFYPNVPSTNPVSPETTASTASTSPPITHEESSYAQSVLSTLSKDILETCEGFLRGVRPIEIVPPLFLNAIYRSCAVYMCLRDQEQKKSRQWERERLQERHEKTGEGDVEGINELNRGIQIFKKSLEQLQNRWKASGVYLDLLRARELIEGQFPP